MNTKVFKTLAELEAENPADFRNPPISDADFDAMMARNRVRAEAENARAEQNPVEDEEEDEEDDNG